MHGHFRRHYRRRHHRGRHGHHFGPWAWQGRFFGRGEVPLALLIVLVWHMYGAHLNPDVFPFDTSIFTGRISKERLKHEHRLEYEELFDPLSIVSGGPGREEELAALDEEDAINDDWPNKDCLTTPCARMTACQAINCAAELGKRGSSADEALRVTMELNLGYCSWYRAFPQLRGMVDNPACLP